MLRILWLAACLALSPAYAQSTATLRGAIESVSPDGAELTAVARDNSRAKVRLSAKSRVIAVVPANLKDLKEGAYVGVAAMPEGDAGLKALEVHIFPESMRGAGEGHRPFDLGPGSSMTNGAVTRVDQVNGQTLTVTYAGGAQTIHIDPTTKIVAFAPADRAELKPSAEIIARGSKGGDGEIDAATVIVGRGITPPM